MTLTPRSFARAASLIWACLLGAFTMLPAQPVLSSRMWIGETAVFRDAGQVGLFWYAPKGIALKRDGQGKPQVQVIQMRYQGAECTADESERRFTSLVQLSVVADNWSQTELEEIKSYLQRRSRTRVSLKEIPAHRMDTHLVMAAPALGGNPKVLGHAREPIPTAWEERSFLVGLSPDEAQLLWAQLEKGQMAITVSYALMGKFYRGPSAEIHLSGSADMVEELAEEFEEMFLEEGEDSLLLSMPLRQDAFNVEWDLAQWPDLMQQVDLNDGFPPAYPALTIRCYDFADQIRPDLAMKRIEVQAKGLRDQWLDPQQATFYANQSGVEEQPISFPFVVSMEHPYRYRTISYTFKGQKEESEWQEIPACRYLIDITSNPEDNPVEHVEFEWEADVAAMDSLEIETFFLEIRYELDGTPLTLNSKISVNDHLPLQMLSWTMDRGFIPQLRLTWNQAGDLYWKEPDWPSDGYLYVSPAQE
ncbi:hypothetical protein [Pontibacter sp. G13]|uniref:hypothetical protein n=1 Tax=Pontibacter sp. G13 TaxID=3074898 RepID=UPI00288BE629|nr:hypothetical protein [Pontibacter sp. G13]WNJ19652.1 hypothetical protein RJD25_04130 [Pontibacter sp. G13]